MYTMRVKQMRKSTAIVACVAAMLATGTVAAATAASATAAEPGHQETGIRHVLLVSVDGMHQQDLAWYVRTYPHSMLARLYDHGLEYNGRR